MKFFIISYIHSNYEALMAFQEFIKPVFNPGDVLACLGDIIGYGPNPLECLAFVREKCDYAISGNHERMLLDKNLRELANDRAQKAIEWTDSKLGVQEKAYLGSLPEMIDVDGRIILAHGSPGDPDAYILRHSQALSAISVLRTMKRFICFFGHSHIPGIIDESGSFDYRADDRTVLQPENYYLINPGSIGQPRDRDNRGSFCVLDGDMGLTFYRFAYDIDSVYEKIRKEGIPIELGERLYHGM
jgi:diadenosine tetraphosphatase ApaH/serine/threonine PP2A family protein phosphatase